MKITFNELLKLTKKNLSRRVVGFRQGYCDVTIAFVQQLFRCDKCKICGEPNECDLRDNCFLNLKARQNCFKTDVTPCPDMRDKIKACVECEDFRTCQWNGE